MAVISFKRYAESVSPVVCACIVFTVVFHTLHCCCWLSPATAGHRDYPAWSAGSASFWSPPPPNTKYTPAHLPSPAQSLPQPQCGISTHNNNRSLTSSRAGSRRTCRGPGRRWTPAGGGTSAWTTLAPALPVTPSGKPCSTALGTTSRCGRPYRRPRGGRQQTNHPGHCFSRQNGRCTRYEGMFGWCRMGS